MAVLLERCKSNAIEFLTGMQCSIPYITCSSEMCSSLKEMSCFSWYKF